MMKYAALAIVILVTGVFDAHAAHPKKPKTQLVLMHSLWAELDSRKPTRRIWYFPDECLKPVRQGGGWGPFIKQYDDLYKKTGVKRIYLDRIFGLDPRDNDAPQFGAAVQMAKIKKIKSLANKKAFVRDWRKAMRRYKLEQVIAYIGSPRNDRDYQALTSDAEKNRYKIEAVDAITSAGMAVGFDAMAGLYTTPEEVQIANGLAAIGVPVYLEARSKYYQGFHHKQMAGIIETASWYNKQGGANAEIESANDVILVLHIAQIGFKTSPKNAAKTIQKWMDYRTPGGRKFSIGVYHWVAEKLLKAGLWNPKWVE